MSIGEYIVDLYKNPQRYNKFWVALGTAAASALVIAFTDNPYLPVLVNLAGALGVVATPNKGVVK